MIGTLFFIAVCVAAFGVIADVLDIIKRRTD